MANKGKIETNEKRKRLALKYQEKRKELKLKAYDKSLSVVERFKVFVEFSKLPRNSAKNRVVNRCKISGRPRGYYRDFAMSRSTLRESAGFCLIPGLKKSSW